MYISIHRGDYSDSFVNTEKFRDSLLNTDEQLEIV